MIAIPVWRVGMLDLPTLDEDRPPESHSNVVDARGASAGSGAKDVARFHCPTKTSRALSVSSVITSSTSGFPKARIEHVVRDVDQQVQTDNEAGENNRHAHDDRVVTSDDRCDEVLGDSRDGEDVLDDERARHHRPEHRPCDSDHGHERVFEGMYADDAPPRKTLRARHTDIVALEGFDHHSAQ